MLIAAPPATRPAPTADRVLSSSQQVHLVAGDGLHVAGNVHPHAQGLGHHGGEPPQRAVRGPASADGAMNLSVSAMQIPPPDSGRRAGPIVSPRSRSTPGGHEARSDPRPVAA